MPTDISPSSRMILRLEGLGVFALATLGYYLMDRSWLSFAMIFFLPDVGFLAYLAGPRVGAWVYNLLHTYSVPILLLAIGFLEARRIGEPGLAIAIIWIAHIGLDRALGFGLKEPEGFRFTHLGGLGSS